MSRNAYLLGVDGGGTKTIARLVRLQDDTILRSWEGVAEASNPRAVGLAQAQTEIETAVLNAYAQSDCDPGSATRGCFAIAGSDQADVREAMLAWARSRRFARDLLICNDADPLIACLPDHAGVGLISGTGSFAYGRSPAGRVARAGGWGYRFGDEGSGYAIAVSGLRAAAEAADGRGQRTDLLDHFLQHFQCNGPRELIERLYAPEMDRRSVARLAPLVLHLAEEGDAMSVAIREQAARDLTELVTVIAKRLAWTNPELPLAITGGVLLNSETLRSAVCRLIEEAGYHISVTLVPHPVAGAIELARSAG